MIEIERMCPVPPSAEAGNAKLVHGSTILLNEIIGFPNGLSGVDKKFPEIFVSLS